MTRLPLALLAALALAGCPDPESSEDISIYAITSAPSFQKADVVSDDEERSVTMTAGVALAVSCWDTCDYSCENATLVAGNPDLLGVRLVYRRSGYPGWALLARAAGTTTLTVTTACASQVYDVTVEAQ
jgi:hypothetical protein